MNEIYLGNKARKGLLSGILILSEAVQKTLGPKGRNVIIEQDFDVPVITKDGVTVAKEIKLKNKIHNIGAQLLKQAALQTSSMAGDGTTTAIVLAKFITMEGNKYISAGINPVDLKKGIDKAVQIGIKELKNISIPCSNEKLIIQVGSISANSDYNIGVIISDAMSKVGKNGIISIENGQELHDELNIVEGMQFNSGYISSYFVTNQKTMVCVLTTPLVLLLDTQLDDINEIIALLESVSKLGKPMLIITDKVSGEVLNTLVLNTIRNIIKICVVKGPGFGDQKKELLSDIEVLTGSHIISNILGRNIKDITIKDLGSAKKVIVTKSSTTIIQGGGYKKKIRFRISQLRNQVKNSLTDYDKEKLQERIAKLSEGVAIIKVGASSEVAMKEKRARVEDALHSARAAIEEGILPGGGIALLRIITKISKINVANKGEMRGVNIIAKALEEPLKQMLYNAGINPETILEKVKNGKKNFGFDIMHKKYGDMIHYGILDPVKVTSFALQHAASIAGLILTTECVIIKNNNDKENFG